MQYVVTYTKCVFMYHPITWLARTTVKNHKKRLPLLFETWLTKVDSSRVFLVTDGPDHSLQLLAKDRGELKCLLYVCITALLFSVWQCSVLESIYIINTLCACAARVTAIVSCVCVCFINFLPPCASRPQNIGTVHTDPPRHEEHL